ncbi:MAG TPA: gfo/Idh/MocA family oxidoreductase, partial [Ruminococcaceae bacterium]|nr:gfo/Idh/MocA family oxidoreductase [Oscillospiraceae bacterium]
SNDHLKDVIEVEDTAHARFVFANGVIGLYDATTAFGLNAKPIIDIFCERATLRVEGDNACVIKNGGEVEILSSENDPARGKDYWGSGHDALIHDFYDCIASGSRFPIDAHEGGKSVEEFSAIYESSESGEEVIIGRK